MHINYRADASHSVRVINAIVNNKLINRVFPQLPRCSCVRQCVQRSRRDAARQRRFLGEEGWRFGSFSSTVTLELIVGSHPSRNFRKAEKALILSQTIILLSPAQLARHRMVIHQTFFSPHSFFAAQSTRRKNLPSRGFRRILECRINRLSVSFFCKFLVNRPSSVFRTFARFRNLCDSVHSRE